MSLISTTNLGEYATDTVISIFMIIATVACVIAAMFFITKFAGKAKGTKVTTALTIVLVGGFVLRLFLSIFVIGHRRELFETVYKTLDGQNPYLYPLTYYLVSLFNLVPSAAGQVIEDSVISNLFIKLPFMLADIASAFVLYKFSSKLWNNEIGVVVAGFVCFCPLFFFGSAMWGSVITLIVPLMLATLYFILTKRNLFAVLAYCVACLCAKEAIVFFPALVIYYAYALVMALVKGRGKDRNELDYNNPVFVPIYAVIAFFLGYLISLPYLNAFGAGGLTEYAYKFFVSPFMDVTYYSQNAPTVFTFFGVFEKFPATKLPEGFNIIAFASVFVCILAIISFIGVHFAKNRAVFMLVLSYIAYTAYTYFVGFSATSAIVVPVLLLAAFIVLKDKRIFWVLSIQIIVTIFVMSMEFTRAGYYNALPLINFTNLEYTETYHRMTMLCGDYKAVMYVASVLQVINHLVFTVLLYDVIFRKKVEKVITAEDGNKGSVAKADAKDNGKTTLLDAIKNFFVL